MTKQINNETTQRAILKNIADITESISEITDNDFDKKMMEIQAVLEKAGIYN